MGTLCSFKMARYHQQVVVVTRHLLGQRASGKPLSGGTGDVKEGADPGAGSRVSPPQSHVCWGTPPSALVPSYS